MHCVVLLLELFCGGKQPWKSSISKDIILSKEHGLNFEFTSCPDDSNNRHFAARLQTKCQGGLWVQFVKAAFQRTCLSGWVNDPLHYAVSQNDSPSLSLSVSSTFITLWSSLQTLKMLKRENNILLSTLSEKTVFKLQKKNRGHVRFLNLIIIYQRFNQCNSYFSLFLIK